VPASAIGTRHGERVAADDGNGCECCV